MIEARGRANGPAANDFHGQANTTKWETARVVASEKGYWRGLAIDALLEVAWLRERLARVDGDMIEHIALRRWQFYSAIGGTTKSLACFRGETRLEMAELLGRRVDPPPLDCLDSPPPLLPRRKGRRRVIAS